MKSLEIPAVATPVIAVSRSAESRFSDSVNFAGLFASFSSTMIFASGFRP